MADPTPPGPASAEALPPSARVDPLTLFRHLTSVYGEAASLRTRVGRFHLVNEPSLAREVLTSEDFPRASLLKVALGEGSLSSEGETWRRRRRLIQPSFERRRVEHLGRSMVVEARRTAEAWAGGVERLDVERAMMGLTLRVVVRALFSSSVEDHLERLSSALTVVIAGLSELTSALVGLPVAFGPARNRNFEAAMATVHAVVDELIAERRRLPPERWPDDLLGALLTGTEAGRPLTEAQLRDEVVTMLVAGHETTAAALTWAWARLGADPEVEAGWHAHLDATFAARLPETGDFTQPSPTGALFAEVLRLHPPVWAIGRRVGRDRALGPWRVEEGATVFVCPFTLHRHAGWWPDPERFLPERFAPGRPPPDRFAYLPFGRGPHMCAGHHFATLEASIILATLGRRYRLRPLGVDTPRPLPLVTLRVDGGLPMTVEERR